MSQAVASHPATRHGSSASKDRDSPGCIGLTLDGEHRDGAAGAWCSASGSCPQAQAAPRLLASASYHWSVRRPQAPSASSVITTSPGRGAAWGCQLPSRPRRASSLAPPSHHDDSLMSRNPDRALVVHSVTLHVFERLCKLEVLLPSHNARQNRTSSYDYQCPHYGSQWLCCDDEGLSESTIIVPADAYEERRRASCRLLSWSK